MTHLGKITRMNQKYRLKRVLIIGPIAGLTLAVSGQAQSLPEGRGRGDFQRICGSCHSTAMATSQRMSLGEWRGVVNDMVARGAQGTQGELDNVVTYLTTNFGKTSAGTTGATAPAPAMNEKPLSESEIAEAKELLTAKGCLSCHRVGDTGSYLGPDLTTIGAKRSEKEIQSTLVSPSKDVSPENRVVQLTTSDGKTVIGRLLDHDGFSVQFIDANGQLRSFDTETLRKFTIVTTNPMKSYANQMSWQELTGLVRYLSSLKGDEKQ
jgi:putative heme-binding domain-containing protein